MMIWFLIALSCQSADPTSCRNSGPPLMTFEQHAECRRVAMVSLRLAAMAHKSVAYACEPGVAL